MGSHIFAIVMIAIIQVLVPVYAQPAQLLKVAMSDALPPVSHVANGVPSGVLRDMVEELFRHVPGYRLEFQAFPWKRAQRLVELGQMDLFVTFPSNSRKEYAAFSPHVLYTLDYGNLVFDSRNSRALQLGAVRSFDDLRDMTFISQEGVAWEDENVPAFIKRYKVNAPRAMWHMMFQRRAGDFFLMTVEHATYSAQRYGYREQLRIKKVDFIPNSLVEFHIGLRKNHPQHAALLQAIDAAMLRPEFIAKRKAIERKYRELARAVPASGAAATEEGFGAL